jgi:hypothetical protein
MADVLRYLFLWLLSFYLIHAAPISRSSGSGKSHHAKGNKTLPIEELYQLLPIDEVPTTVAKDVILFNISTTRYGYSFGRPVDTIISPSVSPFLKPFLGALFNIPALLHWGIIVSTELPSGYNTTHLPSGGTSVPAPSSGTVFELRNSVNKGLVYLDVLTWESYPKRSPNAYFHGSLNKTDEELIRIGQVYIREIGRKGYNTIYANCQVFTSWYVQALWDTKTPRRGDQSLGKLVWWFRDLGKTFNVLVGKLKGIVGFRGGEKVDSDVEFKEAEELLSDDRGREELDRLLEDLTNGKDG